MNNKSEILSKLFEVSNSYNTVAKQLEDLKRNVNEIRQLVGPFAVPFGSNEFLVQSIHSLKYIIPAHDLVMTPQLIVYRQWEADLSLLLKRICPPGSVFVDVGANFGYFTCLIASNMGDSTTSKVISIEPNPDLLRLLKMNVRINWSMAPVQIIPLAVGERDQVMTLSVPDGIYANGTLSEINHNHADEITQYKVNVKTLDEILKDEPRVDVIKIDVEGFEYAVFRGAEKTFARRNLVLIFEWSRSQMLEADFNPEEVSSLIENYGFKMYEIMKNGEYNEFNPLRGSDLMNKKYANLICVKP
jgi:FkbM family methyltransferase